MEVYLDNAATTRLSVSMKEYLTSILDIYGNPSSLHSAGEKAKQIITNARQSTAHFIHADTDDIIFTPSASCAITLAVKGLSFDEVFYSPTAHKSMLEVCKSCICHTPLKVNSVGEIDLPYLDNILARHNRFKPLICIEASNSEIGTVNDVIKIGTIVRKHNGILLVDATGYIPSYQIDMNIWKKYVDFLIFSGHKLHALKGIGVLWKRKDITLKPLIYGSQENGLVGGTENVLGIASLGKAIEDYDYSSISPTNRDYVYRYIIKHIPDSYIVGASIESGNRLPHNLYMCFQGVEGESLMMLLDMKNIQVSTGSACNSKNLSASSALSAIGMHKEDIHSCIRLTFSGTETKNELDYTCDKLRQCVTFLRKMQSSVD